MTAGSPTGRGGPAGATTRPRRRPRPRDAACVDTSGVGSTGPAHLVSHWRRLDLGGLGNVGALDSLGALGDLGALDDLGALGDVRSLEHLGHVRGFEHLVHVRGFDTLRRAVPPASSPVGPDDLTAAACAAAAI